MNKSKKFWEQDQNDNIKIKHNGIIENLEEQGYANMIMPDDKFKLVKSDGHIVLPACPTTIKHYFRNEVKKLGNKAVLEAVTRGIGQYLSPSKLELLNTMPLICSQDDAKTTWFYFQNVAVKVTGMDIIEVDYNVLRHKIWQNNIIHKDFIVADKKASQFETFCLNISNNDQNRFKALKTTIGYLLSRYKNPGNPKAVILIDEQISSFGMANGGTGKSLIANAIEIMRNTVTIDGKYYNPSNPFSNQRIDLHTDIINYDDMGRDFNLESIFSMMTSGITVNKKYQQAFYIDPQNAPKVLISSNYVVKGPGGNADKRRRCEFELSPYYGATHQPENDFGNLFFLEWDENEWNRFHGFMLDCVQTYLKNGLLIANPINLPKNRLIEKTSMEFVEFMDKNLVVNKKMDKRLLCKIFKEESGMDLTSHKFTKMLKTYAEERTLDYTDFSSGGKFHLIMKDNNPKKEKESNEEERDNLQSPK